MHPYDNLIIFLALVCAIVAAGVWFALRMQKQINARLEQHVDERTASLAREDERLRAILKTALDGFIAADANGLITEFNPSAERTFGYVRAEILGKRLSVLIMQPHDRERVGKLTSRYDAPGSAPFLGQRREADLLRKDGTAFPAEFTVSFVNLGTEVFYHVFVRDITARRQTQDALEKAKEAAEAASDAKTTFLATMSHEIRTPMNAVLGLQELLSYTRLDDEQQESVRLMRQSSRSLLRLIDDILDFSRIEAGKLEIGNERTVLRDVIDSVCATFTPVARDKGLQLSNRFAANMPTVVMTDALRLRQILSNLISNAIKFTEQGTVSLWVEPVANDAGQPQICFEVRDTGIGMSPDVVARCGEPFQQADASTARKYGGSGLGLPICRRLAGLMRGTMTISSKVDSGTRIQITMPLQEAPEQIEDYHPDVTQGLIMSVASRAPSVESAAASDQLILVADDHPINRHLLVQQLEWLGYACEAYPDGRSALDRYRERMASGKPFAVTITDCQMPQMDGYELARAIRECEQGGTHQTALIAFTANTLRGVSELCESCGFNDVMIKPVNLELLKSKLDRWLPLPQGPALLLEADVPSLLGCSPLLDVELRAEFRIAHDEDLLMLNSGVAQSDLQMVMRAAHRIAGSARMVGAGDLGEAAGRIHRASRDEDWLMVRDAVNELNHQTAELFEQYTPPPAPSLSRSL